MVSETEKLQSLHKWKMPWMEIRSVNVDGVCLDCGIALPGCIQCSQRETKCFECENGYVLQGDNCVKIGEMIGHCNENEGMTCTGCDEVYFLENGKWISCNVNYACVKCSQRDVCDEWTGEYTVFNALCSKDCCVQYCWKCNGEGICLSCSSPYILNSNRNKSFHDVFG